MSDKEKYSEQLDMDDKVLLARIDERVENLMQVVANIEKKMISNSEHSWLIKTVSKHEDELDDIRSWRDGLKGQFLVFGSIVVTVVGIITSIIADFIKDVLL